MEKKKKQKIKSVPIEIRLGYNEKITSVEVSKILNSPRYRALHKIELVCKTTDVLGTESLAYPNVEKYIIKFGEKHYLIRYDATEENTKIVSRQLPLTVEFVDDRWKIIQKEPKQLVEAFEERLKSLSATEEAEEDGGC